MKVYLVGGAVRDKLLKINCLERDWVVVGSSPEEMIALGFKPVGKDFPVFLHPDSKEEYALARTERKTSRGYKGFVFNTSISVSLEQDLLRRDLTINAMAEDEQGELVDPYGGQFDLDNRQLKHVSAAFSEDPVRVLRVARFAAKLHHLGFKIVPETLELMQLMVHEGEVDALVAERVWTECAKALDEKNPEIFFDSLFQCGALQKVFPELHAIFLTKEMREAWLKLCQKELSNLSLPQQRFALLMHGLSAEDLKILAKRIKVPKHFIELGLLTIKWLPHCQKIDELSAEALFELLQSSDAFRRKQRFEEVVAVLVCLSGSQAACRRIKQLANLLEELIDIKLSESDLQQYQGSELAQLIRQRRVTHLQKLINQ